MAKNDFMKLAKKLDMVAASAVSFGPIRAAHRTIRELQQEGPSWTGRFSNSWQIETSDGRSFKGTGGPGEPKPLPVPALTGRQALKATLAKDRVVFTISNFSDYVAEATDLVEAEWFRPTERPETALGRSKFREGDGGRPRGEGGEGTDMQVPTYRGLIGGGPDDRESSATADLDWFATYVESGKVDRAVKIEMDDLFSEL
jgi:hypothetical protein|tara:strand:+ start:2262 stop:2864 length:603 start_codon:yes stop_codon:yes gene_type:complete